MTSKKDYVKAAKLVSAKRKELIDSIHEFACCKLEDAFVELFSGDNPRFNEARFRSACK